MTDKIVECVPNFSEGRDKNAILAITQEIEKTDGAALLDVDPGFATNRTVVTFVGNPDVVEEAAFRAIRKAAEVIDMSKHSGAHARMGATDVCPFVPVSGVTMEDCAEIARRLGRRVGSELNIPVYLYEEAATKHDRANLANIREGEYEGLPSKLSDPIWKPDFGPSGFQPKTGATAIGAREFLIAYNVNVNSRDRKLANQIALNLREKGRLKRDKNGQIMRDRDGTALRVPGKLKAVKGVGWYIDEYGQAQVSYNLINYKITPLHILFEESCREADKLGLRVTGSELVGLIPLQAILEAGRYFLAKQGKSRGVPDDELIQIAVNSLGLNDLSDFDPNKKIVEYCFKPRYGELASLKLHQFADELSTDSPAPGGGSVAALAGSLAASLATMVANLTFGHKDYPTAGEKMEKLAEDGQSLKSKLVQAIDQDTEAFNQMMAAMRLPKKTESDQAAREKAIEEATKEAIRVPLNVMTFSLETLGLCKHAAESGNENAVSDAGVGALLGHTSVHGAYLNVIINLREIADTEFQTRTLENANRILADSEQLKTSILKIVSEKLES